MGVKSFIRKRLPFCKLKIKKGKNNSESIWSNFHILHLSKLLFFFVHALIVSHIFIKGKLILRKFSPLHHHHYHYRHVDLSVAIVA